MQKLIFRSKWIALIWAMGLLASIMAFFGKGGGQEQLDEAARAIEARREQAMPMPGPVAAPTDDGWNDDGDGEDDAATPSEDADANDEDIADSYVIMDGNAHIPEAGEADFAPAAAR